MNILGYVKSNQLSFKELSFSSVDALTLAWFSYFDFDHVKERLPLEIKSLGGIPYYHKLDPYKGSFLAKTSRKIMNAMVNSNRFQKARVLEFNQVLDKKLDIQFGAIAIALDNKIVIAFRGTDPSYTGWKEDFALSFRKGIVSYELAKEFVEMVMAKYDEDIILCGHSKGGNIVTYLLSQLEDDSRIAFTYAFDGPGFRDTNIFKGKEDRLARYVKIVPQSSFVGVLFINETDMEIIKSKSVMMLQHNPMEWIIRDNDFVYVKKRTFTSKYLDKAVNSWINSLDEPTRQRFTEIIFGELDKLEAQDFTTFFLKIYKQVGPISKAYFHLNKEDRKLVNHVIRKLVRNLIKPEKKKPLI